MAQYTIGSDQAADATRDFGEDRLPPRAHLEIAVDAFTHAIRSATSHLLQRQGKTAADFHMDDEALYRYISSQVLPQIAPRSWRNNAMILDTETLLTTVSSLLDTLAKAANEVNTATQHVPMQMRQGTRHHLFRMFLEGAKNLAATAAQMTTGGRADARRIA